MNKCLLIMILCVSFNSYNQELNSVIKEDFNNNLNQWNEDIPSKSVINSGFFSLKSTLINKSFYSISKINIGKVKPNLNSYIIEFSLKINQIKNQSETGIIINDLYDFKKNRIINGFCIYIEMIENKYYISCKNLDENLPYQFFEITNFKLNFLHKVKIVVNNLQKSTDVFLNNNLVFKIDAPIFNINNIGVYQKGITDVSFDYLNFSQSNNDVNKKYCYDIIDRYYNEIDQQGYMYRGRNEFDKLIKYTPEILLCDNLFFPEMTKLNKASIIDEFIKDPNAIIEKSDYSDSKSPNLKFYKIDYKGNKIILSFSNETSRLVYSTIIFRDSISASEFFNIYTRIKKFTVTRKEENTTFSMLENFFMSYISINSNSISFLYSN